MKKNLLLLSLLCIAVLLKAQTTSIPNLTLEDFSEGYTAPLDIEHAGDSRLYIVEKAGKIWISDADGSKSRHPFLDITSRVESDGPEQGLLGLAFDPAFSSNRYFYVNYIDLQGNTRVSRFRANGSGKKAIPNSEEILLTQTQPFLNHNGGQMKFGPDGYLYTALGDGGDAGDPFNNAQNPSTFLGKMLRIDVSHGSNGKLYSIPSTNPYAGTTGWSKEIWASGLRNPFRFSFDRLTGDLWLSDVGQNAWEEINFQSSASTGGENYGWGCREGNHFYKSDCAANATPFTLPVAEYGHSLDPMCGGSVTGGYVYRGTEFPDMYGKYFYVDYCTGIFGAVYEENNVWVNSYVGTKSPLSYSSFGESINGELYLADVMTGKIYHVVDSSATGGSAKTDEFASLPAKNSAVVSLFPNPNTGQFTVRLIASQKELYSVKVLNALGQELLSQQKSAEAGMNEFGMSSDNFSAGVYILQIITSAGITSQRFLVQQ